MSGKNILYAAILSLNLFPMGVAVAQENRCFSIIPGGHHLSKLKHYLFKEPTQGFSHFVLTQFSRRYLLGFKESMVPKCKCP